MISSSFLILALPSVVFAWQGAHRATVHRRDHSNIAYDGVIDKEYDFIIAGGGTAGLTLAARLSEDSNTTVLVLEAGDSGDAVRTQIDTPGYTYFNSLMGGPVNWGYNTVNQAGLGNRVLPWPRGKVLGGSSAVNGLYYVRPSQIEVDAWAKIGNASDTLGWDKLFAGMKKSETFAVPSDEVAKAGNIQWDTASHGTNGPIHTGWPGYMHPLVGAWQDALDANKIGYSKDPDGGSSFGGFVATSTINNADWKRSYARSGYIDPLPSRPNLSILVNATVTSINFSKNSTTGNQRATGVKFASGPNAAAKTVTARREVILAGGAVASAQMLMVSGVGPSDVLAAAGVKSVINLAGVGQHLKDHLSTGVVWKTDADTVKTLAQAQASAAGDNVNSGDYSSVDPKLLSFVNSATAYVPAKRLFDNIDAFADELAATRAKAIDLGLVPSEDPTVRAGYDALYGLEMEDIVKSDVGAVEILLGLMGTQEGGARSLQVQAGIQHPLSTGRMWITSPSVFDKPQIDPGYMSHPQDVVVLREGLKLARKIGKAAGLGAIAGDEISPGSNVQSDEDWENWARRNTYTEYHPSGACALLPEALGGVVNGQLLVHGTDNLRVVDSSVFTVPFSAHLMAPTFGLAEAAADMIRAQYNLPPPSPASSSSASGSKTGSAEPANATGNTNTSGDHNASPARFTVSSASGLFVAVAAFATFML